MLNGEPTKNLGTTFCKIIARAGVQVWPKPFQNLRSSLQTELEQTYPTYVVCDWLGSTPNVAHNHYLTVTDEHYRSAAGQASFAGDKRGMQSPAEARTAAHEESRTPYKVRENAFFSEVVGLLEDALVSEKLIEPPTRGL